MESIKKKWLLGIFISILSIFAMSHNTYAAPSFNINSYQLESDNVGVGLYSCVYNGIALSNIAQCSPTGQSTVNITELILGTNRTYKQNDIVQFDVLITTKSNYSIRNLINFYRYELNISEAYVFDMEIFEPTIEDLLVFTTQNTSNNLENFDLLLGEHSFYIYRFYIRFNSDYTGRIGFKTSNNYSPIITYFDQYQDNGTYGIFNFRAINYKHYEYIGNDANAEQEQKTQEAVEESENAGNSSTQDAQTGTTGLLNAITGAVSVISSASPTNCKINGNMGNLDMGQLDLCANPAPAFIQTIGSLILILMCVPLAISLFNRFIAIFRSFQS